MSAIFAVSAVLAMGNTPFDVLMVDPAEGPFCCGVGCLVE
jgi:hypothetical protein